jgi:MFS family permease
MTKERDWHELSTGAVIALIVSMLLVGVSFGAVAPLVSAILENRGFSEYFTGGVTALLALGLAISSPWVGRLVERYGTRPINTLGIVGQALGFAGLGIALATEEVLLFPVRFGLGIAAAMTFVAAEVALLRGVSGTIRGRIMAAYGSALAVGFALGVFASDAAYERMGLWCFGLVAGAGLVIAAIAHRGLSGSVGEPTPPPVHPGAMGPLSMDWRPLWIVMYGAVVFGALDTAVSGTYPVEGQRLGLNRSEALNIVGLMAVGLVLGQPLCGWLADRFGSRLVLGLVATLGVFFSIAAGLASRLIVQGQTTWAAVTFVCIGAMVGGTYPVSLKLMGDRTPPEMLSTANARFSALFGVASLLGPLAAALAIDVMESLGYLGWAVPGLAGLTLAALLPLVLWDRRAFKNAGPQ